MPVDVQVEADTGVAIGICAGVLRLSDAETGATALWAHPEWRRTAVVWDFRSAELDFSNPEIWAIAKFILQRQPSPPPSRVAFVIARDLDYGMVRVFEALRERPATDVHVFRDYDEAVVWARASAVGRAP